MAKHQSRQQAEMWSIKKPGLVQSAHRGNTALAGISYTVAGIHWPGDTETDVVVVRKTVAWSPVFK